MKNKYLPMRFLLLFFVIVFSSCRALMGVSDIKKYSPEDIKAFLQKNGINDSVYYFVDKEYMSSLLQLTKDSALIKHHLQPLQASYYNNKGELISFHINCNAPGFPHLNWNTNGAMEVFPPKTQTATDTILTLDRFAGYLKSNDPTPIVSGENFDYYIVVGWAGFLEKQSKLMINTVQNNVKLNNTDKKVKVIFVCTDNVFLDK